MVESPKQFPESPLWNAFERSSDIALHRPHILWCRLNREYDGTPPTPGNADFDVVFYEFMGFRAPDGKAYAPYQSAHYDVPGSYYWREWTIANPQSDTMHREEITPDDVTTRRLRRPPIHVTTCKPATIPRLASTFSRLATTPEELIVVADKLGEYMAVTETLDNDSRGTLMLAVHNMLAQNAALASSMEESAPLAEALQQASETPLGYKIGEATYAALGKLLTGEKCGTFPPAAVERFDHKAIADMVAACDKVGLVRDEFWVNIGIRAGAAVRNSYFLSLLHGKLTDPGGERLLQEQEDIQQLVGSYMRAVLSQYQDNPDRDSAATTAVLRDTRSMSCRGVDSGLLIELVRSTSLRQSLMKQADMLRDEMVTVVEDADMVSVSEAFLRILHITRRPEAPFIVRAKQFEQDLLHADIIALLYEDVKQKNARILGFVALAFPDLSAGQMVELQSLVEVGVPLTDALARLRRQTADLEPTSLPVVLWVTARLNRSHLE